MKRLIILLSVICFILPNANANLFSDKTINLVDKKLQATADKHTIRKQEANKQLEKILENSRHTEKMKKAIIHNFWYLQTILDRTSESQYVLYTDNEKWLQSWTNEQGGRSEMGIFSIVFELLTKRFLSLTDEEIMKLKAYVNVKYENGEIKKEKIGWVHKIRYKKDGTKKIYLRNRKPLETYAILIVDKKTQSIKLEYIDYTY